MIEHPRVGDRVKAVRDLFSEDLNAEGCVINRIQDATAGSYGRVYDCKPGDVPVILWESSGNVSCNILGEDFVFVSEDET